MTSSLNAFRLESDLVSVLSREIAPILRKPELDSCDVLREVHVGAMITRIPDLVLVFSSSSRPTVPITLTYYDATLMAALFEAPARAVELGKRFFVAVDDVELRLRRLEARGLVRSSSLEFCVTPEAVPADVRVVAVEAKLSRWRQALDQAELYLEFANEAYVAIPGALASRADVIASAAARGIGLLSVDPDCVTVALAAAPRMPRTPEWLRLVSTTIGVDQSAMPCSKPARHAR